MFGVSLALKLFRSESKTFTISAMTTSPVTRIPASSVSSIFAQEIRVELARQGLSARQLAHTLGQSPSWVSIRISPTAKVRLTVDEAVEMAEALGMTAERLFLAVLPRLDSNQQPSGYASHLVRAVRRWRRKRALGPLAVVVALDEYRLGRAS